MGTGVNASKDLTYAPLGPPSGTGVTKDVTYAPLSPPAGVSVSKDLTYVVVTPAPLPAPPLRCKRIPLTLDFASTTWDQQSRLTMYELYRSCGLDPSNAFLQSLFSWLAGSVWDPPVTITMKVWSEAVDANWNVLKSVMRGQVITIDPSVSVEWAGEYEVMETTYNPFQGDASQFSTEGGGDPSTVVGSSTLASPADQNAGTITLVLRTYNPNVFFDTSQTPSYVNLPGPILGDPEA